MRLLELRLRNFKGIDVVLPWSRINVLFGPNDAGKTNILEAVSLVFGGSDGVRDADDVKPPKFDALFEFEATDDALLAALLQRDHVPPIFPAVAPTGEPASDSASTSVGFARLRWGATGGRTFTLRKARRSAAGSNPSADEVPHATPLLEEVLEDLRGRALTAMRRRLAETPESAGDVEALLDIALAARRASFDRGVVALLLPRVSDVDEDVIAAAERLAARGWRGDSVLGGFVTQLADRAISLAPLLRGVDRREFRPFDIVWSAPAYTDAEIDARLRREFDLWYQDGRSFIALAGNALRLAEDLDMEDLDPLRQLVRQWKRYVGNTSPRDRWLRHFPMETVTPARWVDVAASRIAERANELAAPIVRRAGWLELEVLPAPYWLGDDLRLEPRLLQQHRDRPAPLRELGLGLRTWAAVAMLEAAAAERSSTTPMLDGIGRIEEAARQVRHRSDSGPAPGVVISFGERRRLLIVDEPERHLHPRAQGELANWLSASADERDTLLATHAVSFLNLPETRVTNALVTRLPNGLTNATDMSGETFGTLERMSVAAGLSSAAEALQTVRLVLLVEGAHDERVLQHFYGGELARKRILVVPVRGALNVNAIFDAPWLSRLNVPLVVLFDDVDASVATARKKPVASDLAARAIWEMLRYWDRPEPKPHVVSFGLPDIFRALPGTCVERAVAARGGRFPGWDTIDKRFQAASGMGFKPFLIKASALPAKTNPTDLLDATLKACAREKPDPALERAIADVINTARQTASELPPPRDPPWLIP